MVDSQKQKSARKSDEIELVPDAWPRFERFIKQIAKAGPQHRERKPGDKPGMQLTANLNPKKTKERPASKGRVHKGKSRA